MKNVNKLDPATYAEQLAAYTAWEALRDAWCARSRVFFTDRANRGKLFEQCPHPPQHPDAGEEIMTSHPCVVCEATTAVRATYGHFLCAGCDQDYDEKDGTYDTDDQKGLEILQEVQNDLAMARAAERRAFSSGR